LTERKAIPEQPAPKRMQAFGGDVRRRYIRVAAIVAWVSDGEAGIACSGLMRVAHKVNEPEEIV
jgi:hypothetical protein